MKKECLVPNSAVWPLATDKKMVLANSFEEVFVCGRRPQCMYKKPYGLFVLGDVLS